jgi:hypothetical protein
MPPRTTPVMQPMDQGAINALKSYFLRHMFKKLIAETDVNNELTLHEFWQAFDILGCVKIVGESWKELSTRITNGCWKNSYPDTVHYFEVFGVSLICTKIAILAREAGFQDVGEDNVAKLLESHSLPLMNEELAELDKQT